MLTAVIPVYNEQESLVQLHRELEQVARQHGYQLEIVFVDDGSTDGSWEVIRQLAHNDPRVRAIRFRRNFGKAAALSAGFEAARGTFLVTLDADLQDDPQEIPRLLAKMEQGLDVVSGWKKRRHDPWHKVVPSRIFNWLVRRLTRVPLHDHNCGFKCYRREIFDEVRLYGELHRFVPVLAAARGWRVGELVVNHRPRAHGRSKYGLGRIPKGLLDLLTVRFLTGFGHRPQHLLGAAGLVFFLAGSLGLAWLTALWFISRSVPDMMDVVHLHRRALFYYSIAAVLLGAQFTSIGLLAELITAFRSDRHVPYSIAERLGTDGTPSSSEQPDSVAANRSSGAAASIPSKPQAPHHPDP